jgi:predicted site-specific integrase-resolvase
MDDKKYISSREAAAALGISHKIIDSWAYKGSIKRYYIPGYSYYLYDIEEAAKYYEKSSTKRNMESRIKAMNNSMPLDDKQLDIEHKKTTLNDVKICIEQALEHIKYLEETNGK